VAGDRRRRRKLICAFGVLGWIALYQNFPTARFDDG
jgi:hypothetical protein